MQAWMKNPAVTVAGAMEALYALSTCTEKVGARSRTLGLVQLRASQIYGCSVCVDLHPRLLKKAGETDERLFALAAWRDAPHFTNRQTCGNFGVRRSQHRTGAPGWWDGPGHRFRRPPSVQ